jgi:uncharacterized damage-inducible protein DinB
MPEDNFILTTFDRSWQAYGQRLREALSPLTAQQLSLRSAPGLRSIGEIAMHIIGCRVSWLIEFLGESMDEELKEYAARNEAALRQETPALPAAELVKGLDLSWRLMADCRSRWSSADMRQTFTDDWDGEKVELSRAWVVWHPLEHDLHHGGELSLTLGIHGLEADFPG